MFRNYLKITYRSLRRNLVYTLINVIGLGIGIGGVIFTYVLVMYEINYDKLQLNTQQIFRVNTTRIVENHTQKWGITPVSLGLEAYNNLAGIEDYSRYGILNLLIKYSDNIHSEQIYVADVNFFNYFNFTLEKGDINSFSQKNTAIISQDFAHKYFGEENALGKQLEVIQNDSVLFNLQVGAVLQKIPQNSSFHFEIIIPFDNALDVHGIKNNDWSIGLWTVTYLMLNEKANPDKIENELQSFVLKNNEILEDWQVADFYLMPFKDQKDESRFLYSAITWPGVPLSALYGSIFMNGVILAIACFNFTNTAVAYARKRVKEIGVRKTFGSLKKQILMQFMLENSIQSFLALLLGMDIASKWCQWTSVLWPVDLRTDYLNNPTILIFLFLVLILITFIAGAYPAWYMARFQPSHILKGDLKFSGTNTLTRFLLTIQFAFSVTALFSGIVLSMNAKYQNDLDWGFDKNQIVVVPLHKEGDFEVYKNKVKDNPQITSIAGTVHNVSFGSMGKTIDINGQLYSTRILQIGENYLKTMGLKIVEGRDFLPNSENDMNESIIVNQMFLETFNIPDPLTQSVRIDNNTYYIVGVVKNFLPYGLYDPIRPVVFTLVPESSALYLCARSDPSSLSSVYNQLNSEWKALFPNKPFEGFYQEDAAWEAEYTNTSILKQFIIMGIFALILSASGLFSMVSLNITKRTKEIGIRKVLGATTNQIIHLMNREFLIILSIAGILGSVLGYYFMDAFLDDVFDYHTDLGPSVYIITLGIIFLTAFLTSGQKIIKAAHINPATSLRYE